MRRMMWVVRLIIDTIGHAMRTSRNKEGYIIGACADVVSPHRFFFELWVLQSSWMLFGVPSPKEET